MVTISEELLKSCDGNYTRRPIYNPEMVAIPEPFYNPEMVTIHKEVSVI